MVISNFYRYDHKAYRYLYVWLMDDDGDHHSYLPAFTISLAYENKIKEKRGHTCKEEEEAVAFSHQMFNRVDDDCRQPGKEDVVLSQDDTAAASPYWFSHTTKATRPSSSGFSPLVASCFTVNYILGTGFLTIPWAFVQGGLVLSTILLIVAAIAADVAKDYLLETMARAEEMLDENMHWKKDVEKQRRRIVIPPPLEAADKGNKTFFTTSLLSDKEVHSKKEYGSLKFGSMTNMGTISPANTDNAVRVQHHSARQHDSAAPTTRYFVKDRKFEVNALCRVFLGKTGVKVFTTFICLYMCGLLWAYTSVFSSAMARAAPIFGPPKEEEFNYLVYAILFGCIVVPLSCLELEEQVKVQVFLTLCRFVMLFLMMWTHTTCAQEYKDSLNLTYYSGGNNETADFSPAPMVNFSGLHKMLPVVVVANMYHHSIPGLSHPVAKKKRLGIIFQCTSIFTTVAYSFLGVVLGAAFGQGIEQSSNLNWKWYHGGTGFVNPESGQVTNVAWWPKVIRLYIICFPAIDVISAFPLNAITVGNNMFGAFYGNTIHQVENNRLLKTYFRLLASAPPIVLGIFVRELGLITDYAGTMGFAIGLSIPAILYVRSKLFAKKMNYSILTHYTSYGSSDCVAWIIFFLGIALVLFSLTFVEG